MNIRSLKFLDNKFKQYLFLLGIVFFVNNIDSAEGGPCKDYG
ncbi:MAG: cytochrome c1, partial [Proteobacteria bacterium]|nr:cytochrome c1 [Pseudomonadota bacterium]